MLRFGDLWRIRLVKASLFAKPVIDDGRIVWGRSTILFEPCASPSMGAGPRDERLSTLLAVAGGSPPSDGLALLFRTVGAEWQRGERAVAAIRLAFAPVPPLDENGAYRLFLAEQALDAGPRSGSAAARIRNWRRHRNPQIQSGPAARSERQRSRKRTIRIFHASRSAGRIGCLSGTVRRRQAQRDGRAFALPGRAAAASLRGFRPGLGPGAAAAPDPDPISCPRSQNG